MKQKRIFDLIYVDEYSATPKYLQLTNSILNAIESKKIRQDDLLPSINELSFELDISRDTAEKGYKYLKKIGILGSIPGKGYFIRTGELKPTLKICLLFNKLSAHKKIIYDSFVQSIGEFVAIDFYIYNNDFPLFRKLLSNKMKDYSHFVIIPHFMEGGEKASEIINSIPRGKLVLMDKIIPGIEGEFAAVYENFEENIFSALKQALPRLRKYHTIKIIFPKHTYYPMEILKGYTRFCTEYRFSNKIVHNISQEAMSEGEVYINLMEDDLVILIERIISNNFRIGEQIGVISYNETPLKKIILNGITTISSDFRKMGEMTAQLILENSTKHVEVPFYLTLRSSL
jgi:DNA-binding transcriptional regulator YhcF (GntR family)